MFHHEGDEEHEGFGQLNSKLRDLRINIVDRLRGARKLSARPYPSEPELIAPKRQVRNQFAEAMKTTEYKIAEKVSWSLPHVSWVKVNS